MADEVVKDTIEEVAQSLIDCYDVKATAGHEVVGEGWYVRGVAQNAVARMRELGWRPPTKLKGKRRPPADVGEPDAG